VVDSKGRYTDELRLRSGVSLTQTRFALSNFCLSNLGVEGQHLADALEFCIDTSLLQQALDAITAEVRARCPDRLPALLACVREANATDADGGAPVPPPSRPATPAASAPAATSPRPAVPSQPRRDATDPLRLVAGVSLAQARFALSEFCLDQFGSRSQALVEAIDRCTDPGSLQKVLTLISTEVKERHRDSLPKLLECVRGINEISS
jgi:hypothetical protein